MKKYLAIFFLILGFYSGGAGALTTVCNVEGGAYRCNILTSSLSGCYGVPNYGDPFLVSSSQVLTNCQLKFCNNALVPSSQSCDVVPFCDSLTCPADGGKQCKDSSGSTTSLLCPTTHFCADGSIVEEGQTCTQTCADGSVIDENATCMNVICPDGSQVPNGQVCPLESHNQTCPDGSVISITATCPSQQTNQQTKNCLDDYKNSSLVVCASSLSDMCSTLPPNTMNTCLSYLSNVPLDYRCIQSFYCPSTTTTPTTTTPTTTAPTTTAPTTTTAASYSRGTFTTPAAYDNSQEVTQAKQDLKNKITEIKTQAQSLLVNLSAQNSYQCTPIYLQNLGLNVDFCLDDYTQYFQKLGDILVFAAYIAALFIILG